MIKRRVWIKELNLQLIQIKFKGTYMKKCGVNSSLIRKYEFNDHIWYQNRQKTLEGDLLHLAHSAVKIEGRYWMKKANSVHWIVLNTQSDAEKEAINTWTGSKLPSNNIIDSELISTFFTGELTTYNLVNNKNVATKERIGSCPNVFQKMVVPMGPAFVTYNNQHYLNTWYHDMIEEDAANLPIGKAILLMIYGGLCNGTVARADIQTEADRVYQMIIDDSYDNIEFRFLIYWLAAIVQKPGINLMTNVWLLGTLEGLGKGTIVDIMGWIIGREFTGKLNQTEIEAGWNDHVVGKQLIEINEFDTTGKMSPKAWGQWLKRHTIEPKFNVRQRNTTSHSVLHIGNFIGTSNVEDQNFIDAHDRRNQFIKTTNDPFWVQYATGIQIKHFKSDPEKTASGFAYILNRVRVDDDFISRSFKNDIRQNITNNTQSIVEEWIDSDSTIQHNDWRGAADWYEDYKKWYRTSTMGQTGPTMTTWGRVMGRSGHVGVQKRKHTTGMQYQFGAALVAFNTASLADGVTALNSITGDEREVVVYDLDTPDEKPDFTAMTPLQKMQAHLRKLDAAES